MSSAATPSFVRLAVAGNPRSAVLTLDALLRDTSFAVQRAARDNESCPKSTAAMWDLAAKAVPVDDLCDPYDGLQVIADIDNAAELRRLAAHPDPLVRWGVARNSRTPQKILRSLAEDTSSWTRLEVARNPATSTELRNHLVGDIRWEVWQTACQQLGVPREWAEVWRSGRALVEPHSGELIGQELA